MAKFELREISQRLGSSGSSDAVISSLVNYLEKSHRDWRAGVALYDCTSDRLVSFHRVDGRDLVSEDIDLTVDKLPTRLVRKFFHHAMVAQNLGKRLVLSLIFRNSPYYSADEVDREALVPITPLAEWRACVCFPLADSEEVIALLVIASKKKNAFSSKAVGEILPLNSVAAMALAQHLYRAAKGKLEEQVKSVGAQATAEIKEQLDNIESEKNTLSSTIEDQAKTISDLLESMSHLDRDSGEYRDELGRLQTAIFALEEQSSSATEHLADAYNELTQSNFTLTETQTTAAFMRTLCDVLAQEHDDAQQPYTLLSWYCDYFGIDRFSLMVPDPHGETLSIAFARGISEEVIKRVRMRIGQGIAGWVAHNRKPMLVRNREETNESNTDSDRYSSDSFLSVPLVHNNVLFGVINFSNKVDGSVFGENDLDRANFLASFMAMTFESSNATGQSAARA